MSSIKNHKQQQQQHVAVSMVVAAMATPCPVKLLLCAIPLGLGFALGVVATLSLVGSTTSSLLPGAALELFFPPAAPDLSTKMLPTAAVRRRHQPPQAGGLTKPGRSPSTWPAVETGISSSTTQDAGSKEKRPVKVVAAAGGGIGDDDKLLALAAAAPREVKVAGGGARKVAFLFLAKWDLPMAPLWDKFFDGHRGLYSVYVHSNPAFNGSSVHGPSSAFHRRWIPSKEVKWGHISMVEAERRLLAHALLDGSNARFVLLSESHVPLFDFPTVRSYLLNSTRSFVESYDEPGGTGRGRYKRGMYPAVAASQWRKGSQWFELGRALAADVVADDVYFPVFRRHCKRNCYADEHYLPTFLHIRHPSAAANRSVTWVDWSRGGPHPSRFTRMEITVEFLRWLRSGSACEYNGRATTVCFLFARKFLPNSLTRFLRFAPKVMGFG